MLKLLNKPIIAISLLLVGLIGCQTFPLSDNITSVSPSPSTETVPLTDPSFLVAIEELIYQKINQHRLSRNLPPLKLNPQISQQARIHSERMAAGEASLSHEGLDNRAKIIAITSPHQKAAENVAANPATDNPVNPVIKKWLANSSQRQNIEGDFDATGIGVAQNAEGEYYFTQIFIQEIPSPVSEETNLNQSPFSGDNQDILLKRAKESDLLKKARPADASSLSVLEADIHQRVNQYRLSQGLSPLQINAQISQVARRYSQKMAKKEATFSHDGFEGRAKAIGKTILYQTVAENLAYLKGYPDLAPVAVQGWIDSPGHQKNMVGNFNLTGIGIAKNDEGEYYFTQLFVQKR